MTFALGLLGLVGAVGTASYGFFLNRSSWPGSAATFRFNPNFTDASAGSAAAQYSTLSAAMGKWNNKSNFVFTDGGMTTLENQSNDGTNNCHYKAGASSGAALATTLVTFNQNNNNTVDTDIRFYDTFGGGGNIVWAINPTANQYDMTHVGVHEFGHALGLGHSVQSNAIMFASSGQGSQPGDPTLDDLLGAVFRYGHPTVSVTGVSPNSNTAFAIGQVLTVTGSGFVVGDTEVFLRRKDNNPEIIETLTNVNVSSPTMLTAELPALAITAPNPAWPVVVLVSGDQAFVLNTQVTFVAPPSPTITTIVPSSGPEVGGTVITIQGSNFTIESDMTVTFGGVEATVSAVNSPTECVVTSPAGGQVGGVDVVVSTSGGDGTATNGYQYTANQAALVDLGVPATLGANVMVDLQGGPNRNCALLVDGLTGNAIKGGLQLGLACGPKFAILYNSFTAGDAKLDAAGHRAVTISIPNNPNLIFASFHVQGVISVAGAGIVPTSVLTFTIFP